MDPQLLFRPMATIEADLAQRRASQSGTTPSVPVPVDYTAPPAGLAGAGEQPIGGLPAIGSSGLGLGGAGDGGGLASNPNVPAPGTSINPATGLPHTAGLTRQELAALKAQQEHSKSITEMSGRQQAAAQLVGAGPVVAGQPASPTMSDRSVIDVSHF